MVWIRIMRDTDDRRFGDPNSPVISLHHVPNGRVGPGSQENKIEATELVTLLLSKLRDPGYSEATFGVICLFEEQMHLVNDLVADEIDEELRTTHDLVVVNPDGFQGDERDVIFYSLSYDANGMEKSALSARQAEREHIQGMLNVAFTRAREEMHIFHSAPVAEFGTASGRGTILDWLKYCQATADVAHPRANQNIKRAQSEFEVEVLGELESRDVNVIAQYPSCGFFIDIVAEQDDNRVAIECDGEAWHLDEHGELKMEDVYRQEILERAGWTVVRIPYRRWRKDRAAEIARVMSVLAHPEDEATAADFKSSAVVTERSPLQTPSRPTLTVNQNEAAIIHAIKCGATARADVLRGARIHLGASRLGTRLRRDIESAIASLQGQGVIADEDSELFLVEQYTHAIVATYTAPPSRRHSRRRVRRWR
jgi:very-short-patch-repair endonuclease